MFLGLVLSFLVLPRLLHWMGSWLRRRVDASHAGSRLEQLDELVGWTITGSNVLRTFQTAIIAVITLLVLTIWGYVDIVVTSLELFLAALPFLARLVLTAVLIALGILLTRLLERKIERWAADADHISQHQEGVAFRVTQLMIFLSVGLAALSLWEVDLSGLLIGAGFLGIVLGMAARQTLGSLIAGLVLMFSRPFEIGDWVLIGDHEGIIVDITIVNTRMRNFDGEIVVLPNDRVGNAIIANRSKQDRLRVTVEVGVDYKTEIEQAEAVALRAMQDVDEVAEGPQPNVVPAGFADSAILLECRFWIEDPNARKRWRTKAAVIREIDDAFSAAGIKIPYPQRELSGRAETGGFRTVRTEPAMDHPASDPRPEARDS